MNLYQGKWSPRGARKAWERTSISNSSAERALRDWFKGKIVDACGWFDENDSLRVLVADTDEGRRVTYRNGKQGFSVQTEPKP